MIWRESKIVPFAVEREVVGGQIFELFIIFFLQRLLQVGPNIFA